VQNLYSIIHTWKQNFADACARVEPMRLHYSSTSSLFRSKSWTTFRSKSRYPNICLPLTLGLEFDVMSCSVSRNTGLGGFCTTLQKSFGPSAVVFSKKKKTQKTKNNSNNYNVSNKFFFYQLINCIYED